MKKDNPFKLDVVSVRLVKDAPILSKNNLTNPEEVVATLGEVMSQFDREVVAVVNLKADLTPINVHFASIGAINEAMAHPREILKASILSNAASIMLMIVERIQKEDLAYYQGIKESEMPRIVNCYVRRYKRTKLSGLQKKYYAKLYRLGKIKRKAYSQAWKYKDEIKKMHRLQEEYLFLSEHCINSPEQLVASFQNISEKKKEVSKEKSKLFKERNKFNSLFNIADRMLEIECANEAFESGDLFFDKEHREWEELQKKLETTGYGFAEILRIKEFYHSKIGELQKKEAYVRQQLNIANGIIKELSPDINEESRDKVESLEKEKIRTKGSKDSR